MKFLNPWLASGMLLLIGFFVTHAVGIEEHQLPLRSPSEISPYFDSAITGQFTGKNRIGLAYRKFIPTQLRSQQLHPHALVILSGRSEFMRKYSELIFDLRGLGYTVYIYDHRGQGESDRLLPEPRLGHVDQFSDYVADLDIFMRTIVLPDQPQDIRILAHSMGGLIAAIYAIQHPTTLKSMVLNAPMFQPNLGGYSEFEALLLAGFYSIFGGLDDVAPGRSLDEWQEPFAQNRNTSSAIRFQMTLAMQHAHPELALGGPTVRWVQQSILAGQWLREHAQHLVTPTLILQAANDQNVMNGAELEVCKVAKHCSLHPIPNARHEMWMERDDVRTEAMAHAIQYLSY